MKNKGNEVKNAVTLQYDYEKLAAIRMYIKGDEKALEEELTLTIDKIYNRVVPPSVKQYLAFQKSREEDANRVVENGGQPV